MEEPRGRALQVTEEREHWLGHGVGCRAFMLKLKSQLNWEEISVSKYKLI